MLIQADAALIPLMDKSIHCVVTSPPYWGLRKYSGDQGRGMFPNLGLEPTPIEFVHNIVMIFREVRRVLRDDGVVWMNMADCYAGGGRGGQSETKLSENWQSKYQPSFKGIESGNLMLMPFRIAIALQNDGWLMRRDLIWWKRNPMPESPFGWSWQRHKLKDENDEPVDCPGCEKCLHDHPNYPDYHVLKTGSWRHTTGHEYIFMLTKKMKYWSDQEVVRELPSSNTHSRGKKHRLPKIGKSDLGIRDNENWHKYVWDNADSRNPRSVLDIPTASYKGAHFATYPPNLIAPLIRATCPRWACPVCGQGWSPVVEKKIEHTQQTHNSKYDPDTGWAKTGWKAGRVDSNIKGYRPTCEHPHTIEQAIPGVTLDPFVGSGTTVMVAKQLLMQGVGLDISMQYLDQQAKVRAKEGSPSNALNDLPLFNALLNRDGNAQEAL